MGVVAVAGGTGDVGRTIVDQLRLSGKHKVLVLTRKPLTTPEASALGLLEVSYDDIDGTARALENNSVDTIISALSLDGSVEQAQLNLIAAADKSSTTKRFLPSEYSGYAPTGENENEFTGYQLRAASALAKSGLMYTRFANGIFMDYFGHPNIPSHLRPFTWVIDFESRRAAIPGTGNERITLTYSKDVARFVDRLVDEPKWPEYCIVSGSDTTFHEIVAIAERVTGDTFTVTYDTLNDLKKGKATPMNKHISPYADMDSIAMTAALGAAAAEELMELPKEGRLNLKFPEIQPTSIEQLITRAWSKDKVEAHPKPSA